MSNPSRHPVEVAHGAVCYCMLVPGRVCFAAQCQIARDTLTAPRRCIVAALMGTARGAQAGPEPFQGRSPGVVPLGASCYHPTSPRVRFRLPPIVEAPGATRVSPVPPIVPLPEGPAHGAFCYYPTGSGLDETATPISRQPGTPKAGPRAKCLSPPMSATHRAPLRWPGAPPGLAPHSANAPGRTRKHPPTRMPGGASFCAASRATVVQYYGT